MRFIRPSEIVETTGLSRTSIWRLERDGDFPKRRQLGPNTVGWLEEEVHEWMQNRPVAEDAEERETEPA